MDPDPAQPAVDSWVSVPIPSAVYIMSSMQFGFGVPPLEYQSSYPALSPTYLICILIVWLVPQAAQWRFARANTIVGPSPNPRCCAANHTANAKRGK